MPANKPFCLVAFFEVSVLMMMAVVVMMIILLILSSLLLKVKHCFIGLKPMCCCLFLQSVDGGELDGTATSKSRSYAFENSQERQVTVVPNYNKPRETGM